MGLPRFSMFLEYETDGFTGFIFQKKTFRELSLVE